MNMFKYILCYQDNLIKLMYCNFKELNIIIIINKIKITFSLVFIFIF